MPEILTFAPFNWNSLEDVGLDKGGGGIQNLPIKPFVRPVVPLAIALNDINPSSPQ